MNKGDVFSTNMCAGYASGGKDTCQVRYYVRIHHECVYVVVHSVPSITILHYEARRVMPKFDRGTELSTSSNSVIFHILAVRFDL